MNEKHLLIKLDAPYRIKYEEISDFDKSLFQPVYEQALDITNEIIGKNREYHKITVHKGNGYRNNEQIYNVISFVGDRGSGKTSCMLSFAECLKDYTKKKESFFDGDWRYKNVEFIGISAIDAGLLEPDEDLIDVILAKLYDKIQKMGENGGVRGNSNYDYDYREFNLSAKRVYESNLRREKKDTASVNGLREMAISMEMRENIKDMINKFIRVAQNFYVQNDVIAQDYFVVIPVDDIDMNISSGYEMLEQIRRYMMVPNVILLLSYKHRQLKEICELYYTNKMMKLERIYLKEDYQRKVKKLAKDYMEKVVPDSRRIDLHTIEEVEMMYRADVLIVPIDSDFKEGNGRSIEQTFLRKVRRCFNMRSYTPDGRGMEIWNCDNIRNLCNLYNEMHLMKDPEKAGIAENQRNQDYKENYRWLLEYIMHKAEQEMPDAQVEELIKNTTDTIVSYMCRKLIDTLNEEMHEPNVIFFNRDKDSEIKMPAKCNVGHVIYYMNRLGRIAEHKKMVMIFREYLGAFTANIYYSKAPGGEMLNQASKGCEEDKRERQVLGMEQENDAHRKPEEEIKCEMDKIINREDALGRYDDEFLPQISYRLPGEDSNYIGTVGSLVGTEEIELKIPIVNDEIPKETLNAIEIVYLFLGQTGEISCRHKKGESTEYIAVTIGKWNFRVSNLLWNVFDYETQFCNLMDAIERDIKRRKWINHIEKYSIREALIKWRESLQNFDLNRTLFCNFNILTYLCDRCGRLAEEKIVEINIADVADADDITDVDVAINAHMKGLINIIQDALDAQDTFYQQAHRCEEEEKAFVKAGEIFKKCPAVERILKGGIPYGLEKLFANSAGFRNIMEDEWKASNTGAIREG